MTAKKKPAAKRARKKAVVPLPPAAGEAALFDRVAAILDQARANVVRAVTSNMDLAYPERLRKSQKSRTTQTESSSIDTLKNPCVLEFLGLPGIPALHEPDVEKSILSQLQEFLLGLGKGFALVGCQKRIPCEEGDRYVNLVFYHIPLRFHLLIDLKIGSITHGDVGQMEGYVRLYDDLHRVEGDNPTIGLILCTEKNETVARYSVLKDRKQIFASKYMLYLPTEEELRREIERERRLIEAARESPETL